MLRRLLRAACASLALAAAGCSDPPPPIDVSEGTVTVLNQSGEDWKDVLIVVNDHFRGFLPVLKADSRANAPLSQFSTGYGQRWQQGTLVRTIDVTAKLADGTDVTLTWGREEKKPR